MINHLTPVRTRAQFEAQRRVLAARFLNQPEFDRGEVHAQKVVNPQMATKELTYVSAEYTVPPTPEEWAAMVQPNLPWAEDHFQERISGEPLNPPPSNEWWPYAQEGNKAHKNIGVFSHTYPERIWPKEAGLDHRVDAGQVNPPTRDSDFSGDIATRNFGIRFRYGDLADLIGILKKNPRSRQAYLPIWFPEDLAAAVNGERVPCTLGYHFMLDEFGRMNCFYPMRSCDFLRFMVDDIYMAGRLLQHIVSETEIGRPGELHISVSSLHVFAGDEFVLAQMAKDEEDDYDELIGGIAG